MKETIQQETNKSPSALSPRSEGRTTIVAALLVSLLTNKGYSMSGQESIRVSIVNPDQKRNAAHNKPKNPTTNNRPGIVESEPPSNTHRENEKIHDNPQKNPEYYVPPLVCHEGANPQ